MLGLGKSMKVLDLADSFHGFNRPKGPVPSAAAVKAWKRSSYRARRSAGRHK